MKHISYIYKYFSSVWYNLKQPDLHSGTLQSGYHHTVSLLSENSKIKTNNTPTAQNGCEQLIVLISFFRNSATRSPQMAAPNRAPFRESFHATQTQVQLMYVKSTYTNM
jgi:hypothetical protein